MDASRFDTIARIFATRRTRRAAVAGGFGLTVARVLGGRALAQEATPADQCPTAAEAENQEVVQRFFDIVEARDVDAFPTVIAPVMILHAADFADAQGITEVQASYVPFFAAFSDIDLEVHQWVTDGPFVAVRATGHATHQGEFAGIAPTGRDTSWHILAIYRIECGLIVEHWSEADAIGRLEQLGAIPPPVLASDGTPGATATVAGTLATCPATGEDENADLVRRWYDEVWTQRNLDTLDQFLTVDHRQHRVLYQSASGADARAETLRAWHLAFPDLEVTPEFLLTAGDLVVARWALTGTHLGPWEGIAPTSATIALTGNSIFRIACGRIAEEWSEADGLTFFQQLGAVEWPPATPAG